MRHLIAALAVVAACALFVIIAVEWIAGCGETYVDAKGERHQYECVLIPQTQGEAK